MVSISSAVVVKLRNHVSVSAMMSGLVVVDEVVECCNMFRSANGASIESEDEKV